MKGIDDLFKDTASIIEAYNEERMVQIVQLENLLFETIKNNNATLTLHEIVGVLESVKRHIQDIDREHRSKLNSKRR